MKKFSFFLISYFLLKPHLTLGQTLYDASQEVYKSQNSNNQQSYSQGLTDEQIKISNTYVNPAYQKRLYDEGCKDHTNECQGLTTYAFTSGTDTLIQTASQMMGIFGFMSKFSYTKKMPSPDDPNKTTSQTKETTDYCAFIPMAGEMVAMSNQQLGQQAIMIAPVSQENAQREMLLKSARSHGKRAETATIQAGVWGATTACYVALTVQQAAGSNIMNWTKGQIANHALKIAASAGLTAFYLKKRSVALEAQKFTEDLAKKLGEAGNCNPITQVNCYCSQQETKDDPKYCLPESFKERSKKGYSLTSCVDNALNTDPTCKCLRTSTCYDIKFQDFPVKFVGASSVESDPTKPILDLYRGNLDKAGLDKSAQRGLAAGKNKLKELHPSEGVTLNKDQVSMSRSMQELGLTKEWADELASRPRGKDEENIKKFLQNDSQPLNPPSSNSGNLNRLANRESSIGGSRYNQAVKKGPKDNKNEDNPFDMLNKLNEKKLQQQQALMRRQEMMNNPYAKKAAKEAELNSNEDKNLFEIIQHRYQNKWTELNPQN